MKLYYFTGNPFMDASIIAMLAAVDKNSPEELSLQNIESAVARLKNVFLSSQATKLLRGQLTQIFPNSRLTNPSIKNPQQEFSRILDDALSKIKKFQPGSRACPVCGRRFSEGQKEVKADKFPLLRGITNFYYHHSNGWEICPFCFLAIQFFPVAILKGTGGFYFFHTQNVKLAKAIVKRYGWLHMESCVACGEDLHFYDRCNMGVGKEGTILNVFYDVFKGLSEHEKDVFESPYPVIVYLFSNNNQKAFVQHMVIPNEVLVFLCKLYYGDTEAFERFFRELVFVKNGKRRGSQKESVEKIAWLISHNVLNKEKIIHLATRELKQGKSKKERKRKKREENAGEKILLGGWTGHRLYLQEVRGMPEWELNLIENLGVKIFESDDEKKVVTNLRSAGSFPDLSGVFLQFVKKGWITSQDFYLLSSITSLWEVRDVLLAVLYELERCALEGEEFSSVQQRPMEYYERYADEYYKKIESVAQNLVDNYSNPEKFLKELMGAKNPGHIRRVYLKGSSAGIIRWNDFVFLAPFNDVNGLYTNRDYLIACLMEKIYNEEV